MKLELVLLLFVGSLTIINCSSFFAKPAPEVAAESDVMPAEAPEPITTEGAPEPTTIPVVPISLDLPDPPQIVFTGTSNWERLFSRDSYPFIFLTPVELVFTELFEGVDERFRFGLFIMDDELDIIKSFDTVKLDRWIVKMKAYFQSVTGKPLQYCLNDYGLSERIKETMAAHGIRQFKARQWSTYLNSRFPNGDFFINSDSFYGTAAISAAAASETDEPYSRSGSDCDSGEYAWDEEFDSDDNEIDALDATEADFFEPFN